MANENNTASNGLLQPGQVIRPLMGPAEVPELVRRIFGLTTTSVQEFISYDDKNFHIKVSDKVENPYLQENVSQDGYVLKILNSMDSLDEDMVAAQNQMMMYLNSKGFNVPRPVKNVTGTYMTLTHISPVQDSFTENNVSDGRIESKYMVRLLTFVTGQTQHNVPHTHALAYESGCLIAKIDNQLKDFHNEHLKRRNSIWSLDSTPKLSQFVYAVRDEHNRRLIHEVLHVWDQVVMPVLPQLERGYIHGDFNDHNIMVTPDTKDPTVYHISGILDFGDIQYSCHVFELAITIMYQMVMGKVEDAVDIGGHVVAGYLTQRQISEQEWDVLKECVCARFAQSVVMGEYSYQQDPSNQYLLSTAKQGWTILRNLWDVPKDQIIACWRAIVKEYQK